VHRISGVALAIFLPLHFLVLGLAIQGAGSLDAALRLTQLPGVKIAETILVLLVVVHFLGGLRLLLIENLPWFGGQRRLALIVAGISGLAALVFLFLVF